MYYRKFLSRRGAALGMAVLVTASLVAVPQDKAFAAKSIKELEKDKASVEKEIKGLDSQLVDILSDISVLENDISRNKQDIADAKVELEEAEAAVEKQHTDMAERVAYMYENNQDQSILAILCESKSIADFLNQVEYANSVYEYDANMLETYQATTEAVEELKTSLEDEQVELKSKESQLASKKATLKGAIATKKNQVKDFDSQIKKAKEEAARRAAEEARRRAEAQARANAEAANRAAAEEAARRSAASSTSSQSSSSQSSSSNSSSSSSSSSAPSTPSGGNPKGTTGVSGSAVASYACQFIGNPYKWGGNSLTSGCDCSGFVVQVYAHFGINLSGSRSSAALRGVGRAVSYDNIQPGDIVCYSGHVAIYAGGGRIVEAQSSRAGITGNRAANHKTILAIRRVI